LFHASFRKKPEILFFVASEKLFNYSLIDLKIYQNKNIITVYYEKQTRTWLHFVATLPKQHEGNA